MDTGASITCVHPSIFTAIKPQPKHAPSLHKTLTDVQGTALESLGRFTFLFRLPDGSSFTFPAFVIKNLSSACILGADFLRNAKISLNLNENTASLPDGSVAAITMATTDEATTLPEAAAAATRNMLLPVLRAGETTIIPPFSSKHVSAAAHFPPGMNLPSNKLVECHGDENSILNGAIQLTDNSKTRVTMLNPTAEPITVPRGEIVAHISALPEEEELLQLLPASDNQPIAAIHQAVTDRTTACHICENTDESCPVCSNIIAAAAERRDDQNHLQATSCVTNATWGPKITTAKTGNKNEELHKQELLKTINKLSFKEKQLHLRKNLKISCTDQKMAKRYWALVDSYHDIFSDSEDDLGHTTSIEHDIKLKSEDPIHIKQFRIPFSQRQFIENKVNHLVKQKVLEDSTSPYNTPIFAIPKKPVPGQPQGYRLIQDLRAINEHSLTDKYNLADIKECMDKVGTRNATVFSSLDLTSGFFQISIKPSARKFTAFTIPGKGKYQWARVCLGLHGAPSTFAKLMTLVMAGLPQAMTYLDDVLVASAKHEDHIHELKQCFERLRQHGLKLNPFKSEIAASSVQYLGHTLTANGITVSDLKCKAIENFPTPTSRASIRQFVGLANFYRPLIKDFNKHSGHLTALIKDKAQYRSGPMPHQAQEAFLALKNQLIKRPVIAFPDPNKQFHLATDASSGDDTKHGGLGAVLTQVIDGQHRTIAYASRALRDSENNYSAYLLELLAIVWAIDHFSVYLHNTHFTVYTDHKPIPKMAKAHKKTFNRLHQLMNEYNCEIVYRAGKDNAVADALSRNTIAAMEQNYKQSPDNIRHLQAQDELCQTILRAINPSKQDKEVPKQIATLAPYCAIKDGILVIYLSTHHDGLKHRIITPKILRKPIIQSAHCSRFAGHLATNKTLMRIQAKFWWPLMTKDITTFIENCFSCQLTKDPHMFKTALAPLQPLQAPDRPNIRVHADLFGPLVKSKAGNKFILVITDAFTKFTRVAAIPNKAATTVTKAIFNHWICLFGPMHSLLTDNGREFANAVNNDLCKMLDINRQFTSSIHPQTNSSAETFNKWIIHYMKTNHLQDNEDWEDLLAPMMMAYNSAVHDSTKRSPFFLTFGIDPSSPLFPAQGPIAPLTTPWTISQQKALKQAHTTVLKNIIKTRELMIKAQKKVTLKTFNKGQKILIWYPKSSFTGKGLNAKFQKQWAPGTITDKISDLTYNVLKEGSSRPFVCHVNRLKPFLGDHSNQTQTRAPKRVDKTKPTKRKIAKYPGGQKQKTTPKRREKQDSQAFQLPDLWPPLPPPRDYDDFSSQSDELDNAFQKPSFHQYRNLQVESSQATSEEYISLPSYDENEQETSPNQLSLSFRPPLIQYPANTSPKRTSEKGTETQTHGQETEEHPSAQTQAGAINPEEQQPSRDDPQLQVSRSALHPPNTPPSLAAAAAAADKKIEEQAHAQNPFLLKKHGRDASTPVKEHDTHRPFGDSSILSSIHENKSEEKEEEGKEEEDDDKEDEATERAPDTGETLPQVAAAAAAPIAQAGTLRLAGTTLATHVHPPGHQEGQKPRKERKKDDNKNASKNAAAQPMQQLSAAQQIQAIIAAKDNPPDSEQEQPQTEGRYPKRQRRPSNYYKEDTNSSTPSDNIEQPEDQHLSPGQQQHPEETQASPGPSAIVTIQSKLSSDDQEDGQPAQEARREGQEAPAYPPPPLPPKHGRTSN